MIGRYVRKLRPKWLGGGRPRVVAIVAAYNEERFIGGCIDHLAAQGVEVYLCDNGSTDETVAIASRRLAAGLLDIESIPRDGVYRWTEILKRKEVLALTLDADWILHLDADEIPLPPRAGTTLVEAIAEADRAGCNVIEFSEFTFVPTAEAPEHDHPGYRASMRWYYHFAPRPWHLLRGWKKGRTRVDISWTGGHIVEFPERRIYPEKFRLLHYLFLGRKHAEQKYVGRSYDAGELARGWHGWRATLRPDSIRLPSQRELSYASSDDDLDTSSPRTKHCLEWGRE